jgi:HJR/Mrr/RecB family endonuclease
MPENEDRILRSVKFLINHVSGWTVVLTVVMLYPGLGLLLPVFLGLSKLYLIELNTVGVVLAMVLGIGWIDIQLEATKRQRLLEWTSNLRLLDSKEFEWLVGEMFRREGWNVQETGQSDGPDGNIDLIVAKGSERSIVQCKRWESWVVGVDEIRKFAGTLMRENLPASSGIYVTLSSFGKQAREEAEQIGIELVDSTQLLARIEKVKKTEQCPLCHSPMILDHSIHGWWFRCVTAGCKGKRDLGRDSGRALDFLLST